MELIEILESGEYRPLCLTLWNEPEPVAVRVLRGDLLVSVENIRGNGGVWGWRYIILRPVAQDTGRDPTD